MLYTAHSKISWIVETYCGNDTYAFSCDLCDPCGGECHWIQDTEICVHVSGVKVTCIPPHLTLALDLQSETSYTISSEGRKNKQYSEVLGRYNLVASHTPSHKTLIYKHENTSFYLLKTISDPHTHQGPRWVVGNKSQIILKSTVGYWLFQRQHLWSK